MKKLLLIILTLSLGGIMYAQKLSLNGQWKVRLESAGRDYPILLPGTLDDAGIGNPVQRTPALDIATLVHLTRKVEYVGKAYYSRSFTTPSSWAGKKVELALGRVIWRSSVWIDDKQIPATQESLTTEHKFDLSPYLRPGKSQSIKICIDNSNIYPGINIYSKNYPPGSEEMTHSYTNHTQIKWNGILGYVNLVAKPTVSLASVKIFPDLLKKEVHVIAVLDNENQKEATISSYVLDPSNTKLSESSFKTNTHADSVDYTVALKGSLVEWNEFSPKLYKLVTVVTSAGVADTLRTTFGFRNIKAEKGDLYLNANRIFIRGNLECIIFPKKGYPPMERGVWAKLFSTAKSYGLNTFRFHSWCPPEAAFQAADEAGFYLQVELPHWSLEVGKDTASFEFLHREANTILKNYGNHPSFCFFSMGNELEGDFDRLNQLVGDLKAKDNRRLYSTTTFTFQKGLTGAPQPQDDYYVTQWTKKGWVRGQGVFNDEPPSFSKDYSASLDSITVPTISHEIGQYSVYPDMREIAQYTGNLRPLNFIAVKNDLKKKKLLQFSEAFLSASGKLATLLYKEEIERALKTKGLDGFQLLQLQDFPGQGTALVGLLNAFWQSKGVVTAKEFRQYNSEVTPLVRFPKAAYTNNELFVAQVELANFYKPLEAEIVWQILDENRIVLKTGLFAKQTYSVGNSLPVGQLEFDLKQVSTAKKLTVNVSLKGTSYHNEWNIWVYPSSLKIDEGEVLVTASLVDALQALQKGKKVLLSPSPDTLNGIKGKFVPVFWSPVHFPDQPGTMGLLIKNKHKALSDFPTDFYSDWQWWDLTIKSKTLIAGEIPDEAIIVRPIDNFVRNQSLTNLFEAKMGAGKLIFCSIDILSDLDQRPQAKQLKHSLLKYMNGKDFHPSYSIAEANLKAFFK